MSRSLIVSQPVHIRQLAQRLSGLPFEIVWPIVENLDIFRLLQLSAALEDPTYFIQCVGTQKSFRHLFPSPEHFATLLQVFIVYYEMKATLKDRPHPPTSMLSKRISDELLNKPETSTIEEHPLADYKRLRRYLYDNIRRMLNFEYHKKFATLERFLSICYSQRWVPEPRPGTVKPNLIPRRAPSNNRYILTRITAPWYLNTELKPGGMSHMIFDPRQRVMRIGDKDYDPYLLRDLEKRICEVRAAQMTGMANLFEKHPHLLKKASDPLQQRRGNSQHVVKQFRRFASKSTNYARHGRLTAWYHGDWVFRYAHFPLVPFDFLLSLFITKLAAIKSDLPRHLRDLMDPSPSSDSHLLTHKLSALKLTLKDNRTNPQHPDLPPQFLQDIATVLKGMAYIYTTPPLAPYPNPKNRNDPPNPKPKVLRTRYTPWSAEPFRTPFPSDPRPPSSPTQQSQPPSPQHQNQHQPKPIFLFPPYPHLDILPTDKCDRHCVLSNYLPLNNYRNEYPQEEWMWLEAFLRVVVRFEGEGGRRDE